MSEIAEKLKVAIADRYVIERELGQGGMATVYLAADLKHQRKVAIKVLRPDLAAALGAERFLREIEVAARLTHPHIVPLHDSGEADGLLYYVMPFIEGESLRDRMTREGELPVADALRILRGVTDALAFAHRHGIVHRDIKPDNVLLAAGHAMVADFGVAKAVSDASERGQLTTAGMAVGTPAYMSPEQATADPQIDHRSDIHAVGVLGYEMLTGRLPFAGTTAQAVLAALIAETPEPPSRYRGAVAPPLDALVMRCLEKKPADRWQSATELLTQLEQASTPSGGVTPVATTPMPAVVPRRSSWVPPVAATAVVIVAAMLGWTALHNPDAVLELGNIRQLTRAPGLEFAPAVSPDGREVVYAAGRSEDAHLYVMDIAGGRPIALTADRPGEQTQPRWTRDGRNIDFLEGNTYLRIPRFGGVATRVSDWAGFNDEAAADAPGDGVFRRLPRGAHSLTWSPDGKRLAYVTGNFFYVQTGNLGNIAPSVLWVADSAGANPVEVADGGSLNEVPEWLPDSRGLLFVSDRDGPRDLYVVRLDKAGRPRGEPRRITTGLNPHSVSVSTDGATVAYSQLIYRSNIWAIDIPASGSVSIAQARPITTGNQVIEAHDVSQDGRIVAYDTDVNGAQDIYVRRLEEPEPHQVTRHPGYDFHPSFSPDGREIVFHSTRNGNRDVFLIDVDGGNEVQLTSNSADEQNPEFSPDGLRILVRVPGHGIGIIARDAVGGAWGPLRLVTPQSPNASWLPDSRHLALATGDSLLVVDLEGRPTFTLDPRTAGLRFMRVQAAADGGAVYAQARAQDGAVGIYEVPLSGGPPRLRIRLDDPSRQLQFSMSLHGRTLYMSLVELESDIYVADLARR